VKEDCGRCGPGRRTCDGTGKPVISGQSPQRPLNRKGNKQCSSKMLRRKQRLYKTLGHGAERMRPASSLIESKSPDSGPPQRKGEEKKRCGEKGEGWGKLLSSEKRRNEQCPNFGKNSEENVENTGGKEKKGFFHREGEEWRIKEKFNFH